MSTKSPLPATITTKRVAEMLERFETDQSTFDNDCAARRDQLFEFVLSVENGRISAAAQTLGAHWKGMYTLAHLRLIFRAYLQLQAEQDLCQLTAKEKTDV